ncbi:MAG: hypothetical protein ACRD2K_06950, partial [Terriglobales bacterium]
PPKSDPTPRSAQPEGAAPGAQPAAAGEQPVPPPTQVNEAGGAESDQAASANPNAKPNKDDKNQTSTSKKKKKSGLRKIIPF